MRYSIDEYDSEGMLKVPKWLWLGWLFLAKAWIVFIVAGASRDLGAKVLEIIYPVHQTLYVGLATGLPAMFLIWLTGIRHSPLRFVGLLYRYGRSITLVTIFMQLALVSYQIYLDSLRFNWVNAFSLVGLGWLLLYTLKSQRVKACFKHQKVRSSRVV